MATVKIDGFGGVMPRVHPSLLPDGMATVAHNCRLKNGKLVPLREPSFVNAGEHTVYFENGLARIADANSVYCWKHTLADGTARTDFLAFPGRVYFAHGNIADDQYDRIFVSGETGIGFTTAGGAVMENCPAAYLFDRGGNSIVRHCICKEAMSAPRVSFDGTLGDGDVGYAHFFVAWVDAFGYDSPTSGPSLCKNSVSQASYVDEPLKYSQGGLVRFQPLFVPREAEMVRVYKTNAGNEVDNIQLVREFGKQELGNLGSEFTVRVDDTQAGETMPEIESPPADLVDMSFVPGNFYAGRSLFRPHTVMFSDVDNPTNWPMAYQYDVRDNIVKLAVTANSVFALTDGTPYVLSGTAPESMTVASLSTAAACVGERSVVVYRNNVFFASNEGLMAIADAAGSGTLCRNLTERYFTKEQWLALNPESCRIGALDNALHMFFTLRDGSHRAYIFDLAEDANALTTHDEVATCVCTDDRTDDLYFVRREGV